MQTIYESIGNYELTSYLSLEGDFFIVYVKPASGSSQTEKKYVVYKYDGGSTHDFSFKSSGEISRGYAIGIAEHCGYASGESDLAVA